MSGTLYSIYQSIIICIHIHIHDAFCNIINGRECIVFVVVFFFNRTGMLTLLFNIY
jgi:hypothetical protein